MLIVAGVISLLIWSYLLLARGQFWRMDKFMFPAPADCVREMPESIAVIIPARNEADVVGQAVSSLLKQNCCERLHIFLVDDNSTDCTAQTARDAAIAAGRRENLTVIEGRPLSPGWSGKLWAVHQGIDQARDLQPDFFLLTDADVVHAPGSLPALVALAKAGPYDLASVMVKLHCATPAEKSLIPAFVFFFFKLYPPAWIADPRGTTAGAAGGCILVRPTALAHAGGIEAIRGQVIDDCALAARVKGSGGRVWLGLADSTRSIRPYGSFSMIGHMISRSAFNQLHHSTLLLLLALLGLGATYLLPPAVVFFSHQFWPSVLGAAAWLLMVICFLPTVRLYRLNPAWTLALPLIAVFYMGATVHSAVKFWLGRGGEWKGRIQDPTPHGQRQ